MKLLRILFVLILLVGCTPKEEIIHPKGIIITTIGDVRSNGKNVSLSQEITDNDNIYVGKNSLCDIQLLDSESLVVIRLKPYSKFKLTGKMIGSTKENYFHVELGNAIFNVAKMSSDDKIITKTPVTTAGVRGTKYEVNVNSNKTTNIIVLEGEVATKVRIPELDKYSKSEIKNSKILKKLDGVLDDGETKISEGESTQIAGDTNSRILKKTGIGDKLANTKPEDLDKNIEVGKAEDEISKLEDEELKLETKKLDPKVRERKLKEYDQINPFEKKVINDKTERKKVINARFKKIEKDWLQQLQEFLNNLFK
ncbi:MAG: FecR domain-containing protein [Leptospiraceae bacterium]|nr:FecR domain-containing protein [Leptospiraceae bacterium]